MAGCSARLIFHIFSCKSGGSTNDSLAWEISDLRHLIEVDKRLPEPFYIVGDEAFTTTSQLLSPWPGRSLGPWKDSFNYHLSCMRQSVERAFGLLTQRWGIFWRPLRCRFSTWSLVCTVAAKLHNFCIEEGEVDAPVRHQDDYEARDSAEVQMNDEERDEVRSTRATGRRREDLTFMLEQQGIRRPVHSMFSREL